MTHSRHAYRTKHRSDRSAILLYQQTTAVTARGKKRLIHSTTHKIPPEHQLSGDDFDACASIINILALSSKQLASFKPHPAESLSRGAKCWERCMEENPGTEMVDFALALPPLPRRIYVPCSRPPRPPRHWSPPGALRVRLLSWQSPLAARGIACTSGAVPETSRVCCCSC